MSRNLDTQWLRTFVTVAETANMTQTGQVLNLTQGAVSQQIKKLEQQLGVALFERGKHRLVLTEAGERLLGRARRMLTLNDTIWSEMTDTCCDGKVAIGVPLDLIGGEKVPRLLRSFAERFPDVEIALRCAPSADLKARVASGKIDLAVLEEHPSNQLGDTLYADRLIWVGARGGKAVWETPLRLSMISSACVFRPAVLEALDATGRAWKSVFESDNRDATIAMIRMDMAIGALLASAVPSSIEELPPACGLPRLPNFNVTLSIGPSPSRQARLLADHLCRGFTTQSAVPFARQDGSVSPTASAT